MAEIGLRELRQNASDVVRRAEAGETVTVTVSGRPVAQLTGIRERRWRRYDEVAELLAQPADEGWRHDRELIDDRLRDPWEG